LNKEFQTVSLSNLKLATEGNSAKFPFLLAKTLPDYIAFFQKIAVLGTAAHELYGHGSGTLFKKQDVEGGNIPNLLTPEQFVKRDYEEDETDQTAFGGVASGLEKCRAEVTSLSLPFKDRTGSSALDLLAAGLKTLTCSAPEVNH
jgi:hypothetical protein